MRLTITRSQKKTGMISKEVVFCLHVRSDLSEEEKHAIQEYGLGKEVIYNSEASRNVLPGLLIVNAVAWGEVTNNYGGRLGGPTLEIYVSRNDWPRERLLAGDADRFRVWDYDGITETNAVTYLKAAGDYTMHIKPRLHYSRPEANAPRLFLKLSYSAQYTLLAGLGDLDALAKA